MVWQCVPFVVLVTPARGDRYTVTAVSAELHPEDSMQVDDIDRTVAGLPELVRRLAIASDPGALVGLRITDVDQLRRVIDRIRRTGKVTGTKTLIVLGNTRGRD